jgi:hypothetical protein
MSRIITKVLTSLRAIIAQNCLDSSSNTDSSIGLSALDLRANATIHRRIPNSESGALLELKAKHEL